MSQTSLLDAFGMSLEEITALKKMAGDETFGDKGRYARLTTAGRTDELGPYITEQLWECTRILSEVGLYHRMYLVQELTASKIISPKWDQILDRIYGDPIAIRNRVVWLFLHACLQAERDFAFDVCPAHSREDVLTGRFLEGIKGACASWAKTASTYLKRTQDVLEVSSIDLTVGGGEQKTGGDFALILDIKESHLCPADLEPSGTALTSGSRGDVFVPLLFQAKCYTGKTADISQKNETRGYQFNRLRQVDCASNYIFYENDEKRIDTPSLPMVKPVSACKPVETHRSTDVFDQSINFATYILRAVNGFDSIPAAKTREDAVNMIFANASPDTISRITILGNTSGLSETYSKALERLLKEIDSAATEPQPPQEDSPDEAPTSRFKP
ncbi:hypothetical protein GO285_01268 [Ralstonia solanacearum]|nr:hypothetical protein [Ralstonia solanacearum]NKF94176.1 hypothetical protein [Ralstonia solanacearum]NKG09545.1 hypothetical protein [Ralstonia solanacearum]